MTFEDLDKEFIKKHMKLIDKIINSHSFMQRERILTYAKKISELMKKK